MFPCVVDSFTFSGACWARSKIGDIVYRQWWKPIKMPEQARSEVITELHLVLALAS
jgi:hypothetical protein